MMQKNYAVSEIFRSNVRHLRAGLSYPCAQHESETVHLLENKQLKQLLHFSRMYNCGCLER